MCSSKVWLSKCLGASDGTPVLSVAIVTTIVRRNVFNNEHCKNLCGKNRTAKKPAGSSSVGEFSKQLEAFRRVVSRRATETAIRAGFQHVEIGASRIKSQVDSCLDLVSKGIEESSKSENMVMKTRVRILPPDSLTPCRVAL